MAFMMEQCSVRMSTMERWVELEFDYARRLRASNREQRKALYVEAYSEVSKARMAGFTSADPESRTAGTSKGLVATLTPLCRLDQRVLEVGCGRGYTCWKLAPLVKEIVGTDVSAPALAEARELLSSHGITNAQILEADGEELTARFGTEAFDLVLSIEVYEHLHRDDGLAHLREVYSVLKPGGAYVIVTPHRMNGPTDVTCMVYPDSRECLGFHLNETTNKELMADLRAAGFTRFSSVLRLNHRVPALPDIWYPARLCAWAEAWHPALSRIRLGTLSGHFLGIMLRAVKTA
jgi:SAM-dependent methyltransferase